MSSQLEFTTGVEMQPEHVQQIAHPVAKSFAVFFLAAGSWTLQDWSHFFSAAAGATGFFYSLHLIAEWWWKKKVRSIFIARGWYRARDNVFFPRMSKSDDKYNG